MLKKVSSPWPLKCLGPAAQLALASVLVLERFQNPAFDFLIGFLTGFSLVGSLVYLYFTARETFPQRRISA